MKNTHTPISGKRKNPSLSKSSFLKGQQCHKYLYLYKYHPELQDDYSEQQQAIFQSGTDVGVLAQQLFPDGVEISFDGRTISDQVALTKQKMEEGVTTIYEASFKHQNVFVKVDILQRNGDSWELYEVKSSTGLKELYIDDVSVQSYVLSGAGIQLSRACVVYINNQYVRQGDIDVRQLFTIDDITEDVIENQEDVKGQLHSLQDILLGETPEIDIGEHCDDPYECPFKSHCWSDIPEESVFSLRGRGVDKYELYRKGIIGLKDVPRDELNEKQSMQVEGTLEQKDHIDKGKIKEFLATLWYPMYFLDFETIMPCIPLYDGIQPYQKIPFQYSLHYLEREEGELAHFEFLGDGKTDPRRELTSKLVDAIPENACVIVYNKGFEKSVLSALKIWYPEYEDKLDTIIINIRDLMVPFRSRDCYLWQMNGSYSIKIVLPALVPDFSYEGLEVSDGGMAMFAYERLGQVETDSEKEKIRSSLIEYCKLDTLAMVKIVEKLRNMYAS